MQLLFWTVVLVLYFCEVHSEPQSCEKGGSGLLLPLFGDDEQEWPESARAVLYGVSICWFFLGVSIIADIFMSSIEAITSKRRQHLLENGQTVTVRVWNATVANLTLMALGSSAPEILLNVIEILSNEFYAGDLGPSTIVGSAAFNMLVIIAICVCVIPSGDKRTIGQLEPFIVTAFFSIFAYVWLIIILACSTPDLVTPAEGIISFLFFPILVVIAYLADIGYFSQQKKRKMKCEAEDVQAHLLEAGFQVNSVDAQVILQAKQEHECNVKSKAARRAELHANKVITPKELSVGFLSNNFSFNKNTQQLRLEIEKVGTLESETRVGIKYRTYDGTIQVSGNYSSEGVIEIPTGCKYGQAVIYRNQLPALKIMTPRSARNTGENSCDSSTDFVEESDYFSVEIVQACKLPSLNTLPKLRSDVDNSYMFELDTAEAQQRLEEEMAVQGNLCINVMPDYRKAQVAITSSQDAGRLRFEKLMLTIPGPPENHLEKVRVRRFNGSEGELRCRYTTESDTAKPGYDYEHIEDELVFGNGVTSKDVSIKILKKSQWEASDRFYVILSDVNGYEGAVQAGSDHLGISISCERAKGVANKMLRFCDDGFNVDSVLEGTSQWKDQLVAALRPNGGDEDELQTASPIEWTTHIISLPWKLTFALVPPPVYCNGWACFFVALAMIGAVTAVIGDLASLLGCVLGLNPAITAITIVAVGTSLPDAFASKVAAVEDSTADNAIGNVTGSNSVNVFLGIGLPWMVASIYWETKSGSMPDEWKRRYPDQFKKYPDGGFVVQAGDLVFSVLVFVIAAMNCLTVLMYRRKAFKAELGGPDGVKTITCFFFVLLWVFYVGLAIWKTMAGSKDAGQQVVAIVCGLVGVAVGVLGLSALLSFYRSWQKGKTEDMKMILMDIRKANSDGSFFNEDFSGKAPLSMADIGDAESFLIRLKDQITGLTSMAETLEASIRRKKMEPKKGFMLPATQNKIAQDGTDSNPARSCSSPTSTASKKSVQARRSKATMPSVSTEAAAAPAASGDKGVAVKVGFKKKGFKKKDPSTTPSTTKEL